MPTDGVKSFPLGIKAMFLNIHQYMYNPIFKSNAFQSLPYLYSVPHEDSRNPTFEVFVNLLCSGTC